MTLAKSMYNYPLVKVDVDNFSDQPGSFCMSYGFDNSQLVESIDNIGLINNPYIIRNKNKSSIEVVTGFRRILALKELRIKEVFCFDLTDAGLTSYEILLFALHDNIFSRELNIIEKSMLINNISKIVKDSNSIYKVCHLIKINRKDYPVFLKINKLDESIKQYLAGNILNFKSIELLIHMDREDILLTSYWIDKLKLSYNYQIQFIDFLIDISRINKTSISVILNNAYLQDLLKDEKRNTPQKAKEFMDYFRMMRNPGISKYQEIFKKWVNDLHLPNNVRILNPQFFESKGYRMEIDFNNGEELQKVLMEMRDEKYNLQKIKDPWINE